MSGMYCAANGSLWAPAVIDPALLTTNISNETLRNVTIAILNGTYHTSALVPVRPGNVISTHWIVAPSDITTNCTHYKCPTPASTLGAFAITNVIEGLFALAVGAAPIIRWLTRGRCGNYKPKQIFYAWLLPSTFLVTANLFCGLLIKSTANYGQLSIVDILGIYLVRPRISWLLAATLACTAYYDGEYYLDRRVHLERNSRVVFPNWC
jgi:hypothetical protein